MTDTVREQILSALVTKFQGQSNTAPLGDPYPFAWDQVLRAPTRDWAYKRKRSLAIYDQHESKTNLSATKECVLRVMFEIALVCNGDENPSTMMNEIFGTIQRQLSSDPGLGGLCKDIQEVTNDLQIDDELKRTVRGVVVVDIKYRHALSDPRRVV